MREIIKDGKILARHILQEDIKPGLISFSNDNEFLQVVAWGHYEKGKYLQDHWHNEFERSATRTYEAVYVVKGAIEARIFDLDLVPVETFPVKQGEILILLESAHGYTILEDDTTVLEIKNGPFMGVEKDKTKFQPK
ncbi:MAG: hypothetical protein J6T25_03585 [Bacilli bacterium]|nr:hypothetical protein [Bacilli bacterium]